MPDEPRIINTHDQLTAALAAKLLPKKHALAIMKGEHGTYVYSPLFDTNPTSTAWYHYKRKTFYGTLGVAARAGRLSQFNEAVAWVQKTYGYTGPWVGNADQDKVPAIVQKKFPIKRRP